jgi:hypothetical protein
MKMKWFENTKTRFIYIGRMFRILWDYDKLHLVVLFGEIIIYSALPFATMYLIKYSIDMFTSGADFRSYLPTVLVLLGARFVLQSLGNQMSARKDIQGMLSGDKLFGAIFRKSMELNYEMLLDKTLMEKRQMAMKVFEGERFGRLTCHFRNVVYRGLIIGGIIYVFARIELWILLAVVATVIINAVMTTKRARVDRATWEGMAPLNRKTEYFHTINAIPLLEKRYGCIIYRGLFSKYSIFYKEPGRSFLEKITRFTRYVHKYNL